MSTFVIEETFDLIKIDVENRCLHYPDDSVLTVTDDFRIESDNHKYFLVSSQFLKQISPKFAERLINELKVNVRL